MQGFYENVTFWENQMLTASETKRANNLRSKRASTSLHTEINNCQDYTCHRRLPWLKGKWLKLTPLWTQSGMKSFCGVQQQHSHRISVKAPIKEVFYERVITERYQLSGKLLRETLSANSNAKGISIETWHLIHQTIYGTTFLIVTFFYLE